MPPTVAANPVLGREHGEQVLIERCGIGASEPAQAGPAGDVPSVLGVGGAVGADVVSRDEHLAQVPGDLVAYWRRRIRNRMRSGSSLASLTR